MNSATKPRNLPDGYGATALSRAAEKGHQEIVGLLSKYESTLGLAQVVPFALFFCGSWFPYYKGTNPKKRVSLFE